MLRLTAERIFEGVSDRSKISQSKIPCDADATNGRMLPFWKYRPTLTTVPFEIGSEWNDTQRLPERYRVLAWDVFLGCRYSNTLTHNDLHDTVDGVQFGGKGALWQRSLGYSPLEIWGR